MSSSKASLISGFIGVIVVIVASFILDQTGQPFSPWWLIGCLIFEIFMLSLPDFVRRQR